MLLLLAAQRNDIESNAKHGTGCERRSKLVQAQTHSSFQPSTKGEGTIAVEIHFLDGELSNEKFVIDVRELETNRR